MKLFIVDRACSGLTDGPQEIMVMLLKSGVLAGYDYILYDGKFLKFNEYLETHCSTRKPYSLFKSYILIIRNKRFLNRFTEVCWFGSFNYSFFVIALATRCKCKKVVGYDCLFRTYILALKHTSGFTSTLYAIARLIRSWLIEKFLEIKNVRVLYVSEQCAKYALKIYPNLDVKTIGLLSAPANITDLALGESDQKLIRECTGKLIVIGPCHSATDIINTRNLLAQLKEVGVLKNDLVLMGSGFSQGEFSGYKKIPFIREFEKFFAITKFDVIPIRTNAPGIQTKLQKIALLGAKVYMRDSLDLQPVNLNISTLHELLMDIQHSSLKSVLKRPKHELDIRKWSRLYKLIQDKYLREFHGQEP